MVQEELLVISLWDHLVVFMFAVLLPIYARYNYPRFKRDLESGVPDARARQYGRTLARQWLLFALALTVWLRQERPLAAVGLGVPGGARFWTALALGLGISFLWRSQIRAAMGDEHTRARLLEQMRAVAPILPENSRELRLFTLLSLTAGICEEFLFRGYLIWYLEGYLGIAAAAVTSGIAFGLGHFYQGAAQALKIVVVGLVLALFYVGSGTIWIPMALHAALDIAQGRLARRLVGNIA